VAVTVVVGLAAAIVTAVALLPAGGNDNNPPTCWAWAGYDVPCTTWPSWIAVVGVGVLAAAGVWRLTRPKPARDRSGELVN
jgi:hypothetical protein